MKKILLYSIIFLSSCDGIHGWFPEWDDNPKTTPTQPAQGCNKDLTVHFKNNCSKNLIMYFIEVNPSITVSCESLQNYGFMASNETKSVTIHKGKNGYFVFAEDEEAKCTGGHRKAEYWINCERSTSNEVSFDVCH
ncbi:MAG: hypothetical protein IT235_02650 [Bacteroidia bacterium]|nr:hypothetical protein [Bacteroidia bacterium]